MKLLSLFTALLTLGALGTPESSAQPGRGPGDAFRGGPQRGPAMHRGGPQRGRDSIQQRQSHRRGRFMQMRKRAMAFQRFHRMQRWAGPRFRMNGQRMGRAFGSMARMQSRGFRGKDGKAMKQRMNRHRGDRPKMNRKTRQQDRSSRMQPRKWRDSGDQPERRFGQRGPGGPSGFRGGPPPWVNRDRDRDRDRDRGREERRFGERERRDGRDHERREESERRERDRAREEDRERHRDGEREQEREHDRERERDRERDREREHDESRERGESDDPFSG